jgi:hypothetical protein
MSENPKRAYLQIEMDLETFKVAITGAVPDVNISLSLATLLYEKVKAQWRAQDAPQSARVNPYTLVPPFKAGR